MNHILVILSHEQDERGATVGVIGSQSITTAENGGPRGYDAGKKIRGHKRHITTDTVGHIVAAIVPPANIQGRDGGYAGEKLRGAQVELGQWTIESQAQRSVRRLRRPTETLNRGAQLCMVRTLLPPHAGCRGNNLVILRVVDDRPYPQSSAEDQSNRFLIQSFRQHAIGVRNDLL